MLTSLRYLVWNMTYMDYYWPAIVGKLQKARRTWMQILWVMGVEVEDIGGFLLIIGAVHPAIWV